MKEDSKKVKKWQQSLGKYSKRLIIAKNNAELFNVMEETHKFFSKLSNNCSKRNKRKKASKIMLSLKRFIFLCKMSNEKFESSTEEQDNFTSLLSRYLSILIEISFTTGFLDESLRCADITTYLVLHLGHSPEHLVDSILRVINVFKKFSQSYSPLYWKVWQLAEKNLNNRLYLKCLLLAKYWTRDLELSERKPYIKSAKKLFIDSLSRKWINEQLQNVGVSKIDKKKKMTKFILNSLKVNVRKSLKKIFFGKVSKEHASKPLQLIDEDVPSDKEDEATVVWFIDRQGVAKVGTEDAIGNHVDEKKLSLNKNADEKSSDLDQNESENSNLHDDESFKSIETDVESGSDEKVTGKATDIGGNNAEPNIIPNNQATVDKNCVVNILKDLEVRPNTSPESSSVKKGHEIESSSDKTDILRNRTFSQQIDQKINSKSCEEDNLRNKRLSKQFNIKNDSENEESDNDILRSSTLSKQIVEEINSETDNDEENNLRSKSLSKQIDEDNDSESEEDNNLSNKSLSKQIDENESEDSGEDEENHLKNKPLSKQIDDENNSESEDSDEENNLRSKSLSLQIDEDNDSEENDEDDENKLRSKSLSKQIDDENNSESEDSDEENNLRSKSLSKQIDEKNDSDNEESDKDEVDFRKSSFSLKISEENNFDSEGSDEFTNNGKRKKTSSTYEVRDRLNKISPRVKVERKEESEPRSIGKRVTKRTIELIEISDFNDESDEYFNDKDEGTELKEDEVDNDSSSGDEIRKKLDFVEESILEVTDDENDSGDNFDSKNEKTVKIAEVSEDEVSKLKSPSVVIRRVSETLQDEEKNVSSPKKSISLEPQSPITKTPSGLLLGSLTRKSLRSHNSLLSKESEVVNGIFSQTNKDFGHFETASPQSIASILKSIPSLLKIGTPSPVKSGTSSPVKSGTSSPVKSGTSSPVKNISSPVKNISSLVKSISSPKKIVISPQSITMLPKKDFIVTGKGSIPSPQKNLSVATKSEMLSPQQTLASPQKSEPNSPAPRKSLFSQRKGRTPSPRNSISVSEGFKAPSPQKCLTSPQESKSNSSALINDSTSEQKGQTQSPQNKSLKRPLRENSSIRGSVESLISEIENEESAPKVARRTSKRVATPASSIRLRNRVGRNISRIEEVDECVNSIMSEDDVAPKATKNTSERVATPATTIRLRNRVSRDLPRIEDVDDSLESMLSPQMKIKSARRESNKKVIEKTPAKKAQGRIEATPTSAARLESRGRSVLLEIEEEEESEPVTQRKRTTTVASSETNGKEQLARSVSPANVRYSKRLRSRDVQTVATSRIIPITRKQDPNSVVVLVKRLEEEYPSFLNNGYFIKPDIGSDLKVQKSSSNVDRREQGNTSTEVFNSDSPQTHDSNEISGGSSQNSSFTSEDFRNYQTIKTLPCAAIETPKRRCTRLILGNEVKKISPKNDESDSQFFKSTPRSCKSVYSLRPK